MGLALIAVLFAGKFAELRVALCTDVMVGILLPVWALVGYSYMGNIKSQSAHPTQA